MAAIQCHKQPEESKVIYRKTVITETTNNKLNNEHSFANKMKEMANSATKLFHHAPNGEGGYHQVHQSGTRISSNTPHATTHMEEKKKKESMTSCFPSGKKEKQLENVTFNGTGTGRKEEKHGGGVFLANMEGKVKHFTHKVEGKGKGKGKGKSKSEGHDSSSDSSSDDDCHSKKK